MPSKNCSAINPMLTTRQRRGNYLGHRLYPGKVSPLRVNNLSKPLGLISEQLLAAEAHCLVQNIGYLAGNPLALEKSFRLAKIAGPDAVFLGQLFDDF